MNWILCEGPGTPLWCLQPMEVHPNEVKHKYRDTAITRRNACCSIAWENFAKTTDIPVSGSAVKNHG